MYRRALLVLLLAAVTLPLSSQEAPVRDTVSGSVRFIVDRVDAGSSYDIVLDRIDSLATIFRTTDDPLFRIVSVTVTGWASPEGETHHNGDLSEGRARTAWEMVGDRFPVGSVTPKFVAGGEDWEGALRYCRWKGEYDKAFAEAAGIISSTPRWVVSGGRISGSRKASVMHVDHGRVWRELLRDCFPSLRRAVVEIGFECSEGSTLASEAKRIVKTWEEGYDEGYNAYPDGTPPGKDLHREYLGRRWNEGYEAGYVAAERTRRITDSLRRTVLVLRDSLRSRPVVMAQEPCPKREKALARMVRAAEDTVGRRPLFAVGTNALYDLAIMPSVNVEVPIRNKVSIYADHVFPWWVMRRNASALENLHTKVGVRWWLGDRSQYKPLHGWWVGLNGGVATGDFEPNHKGYQWDAFGFSFEGGYQFDLTHDWRLGLGLDLGYYRYRYDYYEGYRNDRYLVWQREGKGNWFGPTAVHVDVKYLIYYKYKHGRKAR